MFLLLMQKKGNAKVEELQHQQNFSNDLVSETVTGICIVKNNMNEDKNFMFLRISVYIYKLFMMNMNFRCLGTFLEGKGIL